jgi:hypothetical protein
VVPVISSHRHQKQNQHPLQHRSSPNHHRQQEATVIAIPASIGAPRGTRRNGGAKGGTGEKPRQEICALLKWASFAINFLIFVCEESFYINNLLLLEFEK